MIELFLAAVLTYTAFEIAYWYYRWWKTVNKEPLPVVRSLLWAVFVAHLLVLLPCAYYIYTGHPPFSNPTFLGILYAGSVFYMVPIWKQTLNKHTTPLMYLARTMLFATVVILLGSNYVI